MGIVALPDELDFNSSKSIVMVSYETEKEILRQKILLNKNTFSFLQEGSKEVFFGNSSHVIHNSNFLLMKAGNCLMTEKLSSENKQYKSILFFFSNEDVLSFVRKFQIELTARDCIKSTYSFEYNTFLKRFVESLKDISGLSTKVRERMLNTKFEEIMLYLMDLKGTDFIYSLVREEYTKTQKFLEVIEQNTLNKLTIKELAFLSNMSVSTFKREFQKHFHISPSKWFQDKRLNHAAFLLKNKAKRPSDVFEIVGYETLSNFIYAFKLKFGCTPKQYQQD